MSIQLNKEHKTFEGKTSFWQHQSDCTKTLMKFSTFVPNEKVENAIIWLSGLTCNEENFITKSGIQNHLKETNTMIICPDTSPRGLDLSKEHESYDFGSGAGFYVNATTNGYKDHYQMYDYIKKEIVEILKTNFGVKQTSIMGHSMGGHGALILALREQELFKSVSAFSPIVNPVSCSWGKKAFEGYLVNANESKIYDATELILAGKVRSDSILIEQGLDDEFLEKELLTDHFKKVSDNKGQKVLINYREGYDHSYYFISSFLEGHVKFHLDAF